VNRQAYIRTRAHTSNNSCQQPIRAGPLPENFDSSTLTPSRHHQELLSSTRCHLCGEKYSGTVEAMAPPHFYRGNGTRSLIFFRNFPRTTTSISVSCISSPFFDSTSSIFTLKRILLRLCFLHVPFRDVLR